MADDKFDFFDAIKSDVTPDPGSGGRRSGEGSGSRCPNCGGAVSKGAVICIGCGFNLRSGAHAMTSRGTASGGDPTMKLVAIGGGAVVVVVLVLAYMMFGGGSTSEPAKPTLPPVAAAEPSPPRPKGPTEAELAAQDIAIAAAQQQLEADRANQAELATQQQADAEAKRIADMQAQQLEAANAARLAALKAKRDADKKFNDDVNAAIAKAQKFLLNQYNADTGVFAGKYEAEIGQTALATYALLKSGHDPNDPAIERSLKSMLAYAYAKPGMDSKGTYNCGLVMLAMDQLREVRAREEKATAGTNESAAARRDRLMIKGAMRKLAVGLNNNQQAGKSFSYGGGAAKGGHDLSIHQYAILGMWAAYRSGVKLVPGFWQQQVNYLTGIQQADGGFGYKPERASTDTMTTAGVGSLAICYLMLNDARWERQQVKRDANGDEQIIDIAPTPNDKAQVSIDKGFNWLATRGLGGGNPYFNYGLERTCALTKTQTIGARDWYREIATRLIQMQQADGSWFAQRDTVCDTSWNLLFLSRASEKTFETPTYEDQGSPGDAADDAPTIGAGQQVDKIEDDANRPADDGSQPAPAPAPAPGGNDGAPIAPPVPGSPLGPAAGIGSPQGPPPGASLQSIKKLIPDKLPQAGR